MGSISHWYTLRLRRYYKALCRLHQHEARDKAMPAAVTAIPHACAILAAPDPKARARDRTFGVGRCAGSPHTRWRTMRSRRASKAYPYSALPPALCLSLSPALAAAAAVRSGTACARKSSHTQLGPPGAGLSGIGAGLSGIGAGLSGIGPAGGDHEWHSRSRAATMCDSGERSRANWDWGRRGQG